MKISAFFKTVILPALLSFAVNTYAAEAMPVRGLYDQLTASEDAYDFDEPVEIEGYVTDTDISVYATPYVSLSDEPGGKVYAICVLPRGDVLKLKEFKKGSFVTMSGNYYAFKDRAVVKKCAKARQESGMVTVFNVGDLKVYALVNNSGKINENLLVNRKTLRLDRYKKDGWNDNSISYFVLDMGKKKILVDAGVFAAQGGKLLERLEEAGIKAKDIDIVLLTHMHIDHIGGLLDGEGKAVFPKAKVYVSEEEAAYWSDESKTGASFETARGVLNAYKKKLAKFKQNAKIIDGVTSVPLFGHTPGHSGFMIESGDEKLLIWGDLIHAGVQFANPDFYLIYDIDPASATKVRKQTLKEVADTDTYVAGMHLGAPALGKVKTSGKRYVFEKGMK